MDISLLIVRPCNPFLIRGLCIRFCEEENTKSHKILPVYYCTVPKSVISIAHETNNVYTRQRETFNLNKTSPETTTNVPLIPESVFKWFYCTSQTTTRCKFASRYSRVTRRSSFWLPYRNSNNLVGSLNDTCHESNDLRKHEMVNSHTQCLDLLSLIFYAMRSFVDSSIIDLPPKRVIKRKLSYIRLQCRNGSFN